MELTEGTRLGPYEIHSAIGAGGMGEVYKATDTRLGRTVAVKVLPPHWADNADMKQRFEREAQALASMTHPHICVLHDIGQERPANGEAAKVWQNPQDRTMPFSSGNNGPLPTR